jgi:hypothetical protein
VLHWVISWALLLKATTNKISSLKLLKFKNPLMKVSGFFVFNINNKRRISRGRSYKFIN